MSAQTNPETSPIGDTAPVTASLPGEMYCRRDTTLGLALLTDSVIVMRPSKTPGDYQFISVLGAVFVEAMRISEAKMLVRASDGKTVPVEQHDEWYYLRQPGKINDSRIVIFKVYPKKT